MLFFTFQILKAFHKFELTTVRYAVFSPNEEKYGPEKTPYLDTFHAV